MRQSLWTLRFFPPCATVTRRTKPATMQAFFIFRYTNKQHTVHTSTMSSILATPILSNDENVKPFNLANVPVEASPLKAAKAPTTAEPAPAEQPAQEEEAEEEEEEEEEMDEEEEEEESEIEDDIASEDDETYGEQSLEGFPLSQEEEAREAAELAKTLGLGSTNEAITRVGASSQKRVSSTIDAYAALIQTNEPEANQVYQGLSEEITALRASIHSGINKIVSDLDVTTAPSAIELAAATLENYLRVITERSVYHCEYRDQEEVSADDVLIVLSALGRPVYFGEQRTSTLVQGAIAQEDDEKDGDFVPMEDEDDDEELSDDEDEEMETWDGKDEVEEETSFNVDTAAFRRLIDVLNRWNVTFGEQAYTVLQTSAEDYLGQLFSSASAAAQFAGRKEVDPVDVRFAQAVVLKI